MLLAYHLITEREDLYTSSSSDGHDPRAVAFPLSEALPCRWDAEANRWVRWKRNSHLEQLKMVRRETKTSRWQSQVPLTLVLPPEFFGVLHILHRLCFLSWMRGLILVFTLSLVGVAGARSSPIHRPTFPILRHLMTPCSTELTVRIQGKTKGQGKTK